MLATINPSLKIRVTTHQDDTDLQAGEPAYIADLRRELAALERLGSNSAAAHLRAALERHDRRQLGGG